MGVADMLLLFLLVSGVTGICVPMCKSNRWYAAPVVAGLFFLGLCIKMLPAAKDHDRQEELEEVYPQLTIIKVWKSGSMVSYYADAKNRIHCVGEVNVPPGEPTWIDYRRGPKPACERALSNE